MYKMIDVKGLVQDLRKVSYVVSQYENIIYSRVYSQDVTKFEQNIGYKSGLRNQKVS